MTRSFLNRLLRLTLLAPDIQEVILDGRQPKGVQLEEMARASGWEEQRAHLTFPRETPFWVAPPGALAVVIFSCYQNELAVAVPTV